MFNTIEIFNKLGILLNFHKIKDYIMGLSLLSENREEEYQNVRNCRKVKLGSYITNLRIKEKALKIKINKRSLIPAVTHEDGSGRLQTVNKIYNKKFYELINEFYNITNIPLLLNTSFNIQGEPIVCSVEDAIKNFYLSGLDELYIEYCIIKK